MAITLIAGLASMGGAAIAGTAWSFAAFALGAGLSLVSRALMPKPDLGAQMGGTTVTSRDAAHSRKIIYGRARVGGNIVYLESSGDDNKYLWLVIAVAGHEIDAYEKVYFNDEKIWDGGSYVANWGSYVNISFHKGDQTTADSGLVAASSKWTTDHKLLGTAYMVVKMTYDRDENASLPNISTVVRGKKVFDPDPDVNATAWSQNPALCLYDYLRDTKYGLGEIEANILTSSVTDAKDVCNQLVDLLAGGNQPRYTLDGVVDTADSLEANIERMTGCMIGRLVYSGGKFELYAGEYVAPTVTIDESVTVGEITVQTKQSRRNAYNGVKGVFLSEEDNYVLSDYPAQISSSYATQDGDPIYLDMALPFTTNNIRAQRIAKLALFRSRQQESISIPCNLAALKFKAGDNISVTNARLGYLSKIFEVIGYSMNFGTDGLIVNVEAIETASLVWNWNSSDEEVFLGGGEVDVYSPGNVPAPTLFSGTASTTIDTDGTAIGKIVFSWTASVDAFVSQYDFQYSTDNSNWNAIDVTGTQFTVEPTLGAVTYYAKVRSINDSGYRSSFVTAQRTAVGDTTPPAIPSNVSASGGASQVSISWTNPSDKDFSNVTVFRATSSGGTYAEIATVGGGWGSVSEFVNGGLPGSVEYFYKLKAVDYSGNASGDSSIVSGTTSAVTGGAVVNDATGNTDATVTVTRVANGSVLLGVDWSIRKASGAPYEVTNPFPVTVTLKRGSTTIKTWSATGTFEQGNTSQSEPFFIIGDLSASWYDTDSGSGSTTYTLSATTLNTSHFSLQTQLSAQPSL
tara:strand:- start:2299 stop:4695 length:2397 start_codon:yes stop_codon:yes gene_type:complete